MFFNPEKHLLKIEGKFDKSKWELIKNAPKYESEKKLLIQDWKEEQTIYRIVVNEIELVEYLLKLYSFCLKKKFPYKFSLFKLYEVLLKQAGTLLHKNIKITKKGFLEFFDPLRHNAHLVKGRFDKKDFIPLHKEEGEIRKEIAKEINDYYKAGHNANILVELPNILENWWVLYQKEAMSRRSFLDKGLQKAKQIGAATVMAQPLVQAGVAFAGEANSFPELTTKVLMTRRSPGLQEWVQSRLYDITGNGHKDVIVSSREGLDLIPNKGNGNYGSPRRIWQRPGSQGLQEIVWAEFADMNTKDKNKIDCIVGVWSGVYLLTNFRNGNFQTTKQLMKYNGGLQSMVSISLGDMTGNGEKDIVVGTRLGVSIIKNYGNYKFEKEPVFIYKNNNNGLQVKTTTILGDFNNNGNTDIVITNNRDASVYTNQGNLKFKGKRFSGFPQGGLQSYTNTIIYPDKKPHTVYILVCSPKGVFSYHGFLANSYPLFRNEGYGLQSKTSAIFINPYWYVAIQDGVYCCRWNPTQKKKETKKIWNNTHTGQQVLVSLVSEKNNNNQAFYISTPKEIIYCKNY